jgi:uncharacterized membrane protein YidH (DUF202 family)
MTLSGDNRRSRGAELKRQRHERTDRTSTRFPWLMPAIVVLAIVMVIVGLVIAATLGKLF